MAYSTSNTDNGFRAVLANLTMSLLLIVIATFAFFFPTYSLLADLSYVCVYAIVIVCMTVPIAAEVISVMMEVAPKNIDVKVLRADIEQECGSDIQDIHDLHVWTISLGNVAFICLVGVRNLG